MFVAPLYQWLFLLHIAGAMIWVGGAVFVAALAARALRSRDLEEVGRFVRSLRATAPLVLAPASIGVAAFGVWLVLNSPAWSFSQGWVQLALALFVAAFLVGAVFLSRTAIATGRAVEAGDRDGALLHLRRWSWGYRVILLLLTVTTWDMVFKPQL